MVILIFTNKNLSGKQKGILGTVAAAALAIEIQIEPLRFFRVRLQTHESLRKLPIYVIVVLAKLKKPKH